MLTNNISPDSLLLFIFLDHTHSKKKKRKKSFRYLLVAAKQNLFQELQKSSFISFLFETCMQFSSLTHTL